MLSFTEGKTRRQATPTKSQLLINIIDGLAAERPAQAWAKVPRSPISYDLGYRKITYADLAKLVDNMAWFLVDKFGHPGRDSFPTLAYFGHWDPRHSVLAYAASKAGYKILLPSPAFAPEAILHLMDSVECSTILSPSEPLPIVSKLCGSRALRLEEIPTLDALLGMQHRAFPYTKTYEEAHGDPLIVLHSSGTTGPPKPLVWTQGWAAQFTRQMTLLPPEGFESQQKHWQSTEMFQATPRHHGGTAFVSLVLAVPTQTVQVFPIPSAPIALSTVQDVLHATSVDSLTLLPPLINSLGSIDNKDMLDFVAARIKVITYGGAPASESAGRTVAAHTKMTSSYGHTENGLLPCIRPVRADRAYDPALWNAHCFHAAAGASMRPVVIEGGAAAGDAGVHELVITRNADTAQEQPVFTMLDPTATEWPTKDLFVPKPDAPGFWLWAGRTDDLIAFESGAKFNPTDFEDTVRAHPAVKQVAMVGNGRPRAVLVIEPANIAGTGDDEESFLDAVWPSVKQANRFCGPLSAIARTQVVVTTSGRTLPVTPKGSVVKKAMLELYMPEIDKVYAKMH